MARLGVGTQQFNLAKSQNDPLRKEKGSGD